MTICYYNHNKGKPEINTFFEKIDSSKCISYDDYQGSFRFCPGDVVFVHPGDGTPQTGPAKWRWVSLAKKNKDADFVFMSTQPARKKAIDLSNVHFCGYAADRLSEQPRVLEFFRLLTKGKKLWDLLNLPPFPEYLLAAYLVQAAAKNGVSVNPEESGYANFWNKAREEFDQYTAQEGALPEFTPSGDPSKLKSLLESIAKGS